VVIALIGVSASIIGITASNTGRNNLRKCANSVDGLLSRCRINSMYRADPVLVEFIVRAGNIEGIYRESRRNADGEDELTEVDRQIMGRAEIEYTVNGTTRSLAAFPLRVSFTRRGALILVDENGAEIENERLTQIRFTNGEITYVINVTPATGHRTVRAG
jgi:hypothetical protein